MKRNLQLAGFLISATLACISAAIAAVDVPKAAAIKSTAIADPVAAANAMLDEMDAGRFEAVHARFAPAMAAAIGADKLKDVWASLPQQFGKFGHRGAARVDNANGMTVVHIPMTFEHGSLEAIIATDAGGKVAGFLVHPTPPPPAATRNDLPAHEVHFGPAGRSELPGTVLLPKGDGAFPAIVLVHGSGPNDRNETVGATRVFLDLAEGLADRGIASLRYEKRTREHPQEFNGAYTVDDETTDDAVAAVAFLQAQPGVDPKRIYIVGHSQGAMMAPRIAQRAPGLAGIVLMAAPARPLEDVLLDQNNYMAMDDGTIDDKERARIDALKLAIAEVKKIDAQTPPTAKFLLDLPASYWLSLKSYDAVAVAKSIPQPLLVLQGDRDFQVTAPDWQRWQTAFGSSRRTTIHHYPALNHLFVAGSGPSTIAEYAVPGHVDAHAIDDIASWIKSR